MPIVVPTSVIIDTAALVRGINQIAGRYATEVNIVWRDGLLVGEYAREEGEPRTLFFILTGEVKGEMVAVPRNIGEELALQLVAAGQRDATPKEIRPDAL